MDLTDMLTILAILLGPVIAVQVTRRLDDKKEIRERRLWVFKTLMATRAANVSLAHVEALNRIDLEFHTKSKADKGVIEAWKSYLDLLGDQQMPFDQWVVRRVDLLVELLHKMAQTLDYEFDKVTIKNSSYYPRGWGDVENDQTAIRHAIREMVEGKRVLPVSIVSVPLSQPDQTSKEGSLME